MATPSITVFVRHSGDCKYKDDETWRRCNCRKHLRWSHGGRQYRASAKTRSWSQAEDAKRNLESKFTAGAAPTTVVTTNKKTIADAVQLFLSSKKSDGLNPNGLQKLERELGRFERFLSDKSKHFPDEIDLPTLINYRASWEELYPSSGTRSQVQARLRRFLRFCHDAGWIERVPRLSAIKVDEPPTMPLTEKQYKTVLEKIPKTFPPAKATRVRALVQLMRHSGLAIRDAVTLSRPEVQRDSKKKLTRVTTSRQKTGTHVSVPLPPDVATEVLTAFGDDEYAFWSGNGLETSVVTNWQHDLRALFRETFGRDTQFTPHCLRDTAAVSWLSAGVPLEEVSKLLGHSSIKTTEKSYAPWVRERQDKLDALVIGTWSNGEARE
ncbi:MAG TPA: site-specific integrase [Terriglobales bacterium]